MKKLFISLGIAAALVSGAALADDDEVTVVPTPADYLNNIALQKGKKTETKVKFTGEVMPTACYLDDESQNQTIPLGQVESSELRRTANIKNNTEFHIKLKGCPFAYDGVTQAGVQFQALAKTVATVEGVGILTNTNTGENAAKNVGVQLIDKNQAAPRNIDLRKTDSSTVLQPLTTVADDGGLDFKFEAALRALKDNSATPGQVEATVPVVVTYK